MRSLLLLPVLAGFAFAQAPVANPDFEGGDNAGTPAGWFLPAVLRQAGFGVELVHENCFAGDGCAMMTGAANAPVNMFGNLMQTVPTAGYTLHRIRLRAAIRVEGAQTRAQMWLRL